MEDKEMVNGEEEDGPPPGWHQPIPQSRSPPPAPLPSAHQVGVVNCGNCSILLMYPYGASSVQCSSCLLVTEIGEHNRRPPWSIQQRQPPPTPNPVH